MNDRVTEVDHTDCLRFNFRELEPGESLIIYCDPVHVASKQNNLRWIMILTILVYFFVKIELVKIQTN